jgi:hypothetical protein
MFQPYGARFITKPSRNSYSGPRDFRPISLTSFLLTTSQPTCIPVWEVCGNSPPSAWVEKAPDQQEIALGIFIDIEGAFNNTSYDPMCTAPANMELSTPSQGRLQPP